jgi:hypothetical protein
MAWDEDGEPYRVGEIIAPAGAPPARLAIRALRAGDRASAIRYARATLDADGYANAERATGRVARRSNVSGNAWSMWFTALTNLPSGWE